MVCGSCGAEAAAEARFCASCAAPLGDEKGGFQPVEERRVVSVLFADLVGFTERTERSDPEDVRAQLTVYHNAVREQVEALGGRVEKLIGDGVFAVRHPRSVFDSGDATGRRP